MRALACAAAGLALLAAACSKSSEAATRSDGSNTWRQAGNCNHAACGTNYFVDASPHSCAPGANCSLTLTLVATGDYHINDEYPYKFKASDAQGVEFLGNDAGGKNVFSKAAGDWQKTDAKSGTMAIKFKGVAKGNAAIAGTFKLSVCSAANCQLEAPQLSTTVAIK